MSTSSKDAKPVALIVDDDAMMRLLIRQTLERAGFVCHEALNGAAGWTSFRRCSPTSC
jgi:DNA-binding response OmpR family regulator